MKSRPEACRLSWGFTVASPAGGTPQHSLHLTALVQLVKEIPEFLFGEVSPESGGASLDGERASPEGELDSRAASLSTRSSSGCGQRHALGAHPAPARP